VTIDVSVETTSGLDDDTPSETDGVSIVCVDVPIIVWVVDDVVISESSCVVLLFIISLLNVPVFVVVPTLTGSTIFVVSIFIPADTDLVDCKRSI
jgi:hypothetical protein